MTVRPDEWARVKEVFEGLALAPDLRPQYVAAACGADEALRQPRLPAFRLRA